MQTTTLWRPVGHKELTLLEANGFSKWPPRLPEQPIFYPVLNREYATLIARDWNLKYEGAGYVTRFEIETKYLQQFPIQQAGGKTILEYWIPAEELDNFNAHIIGTIKVIEEFI